MASDVFDYWSVLTAQTGALAKRGPENPAPRTLRTRNPAPRTQNSPGTERINDSHDRALADTAERHARARGAHDAFVLPAEEAVRFIASAFERPHLSGVRVRRGNGGGRIHEVPPFQQRRIVERREIRLPRLLLVLRQRLIR